MKSNKNYVHLVFKNYIDQTSEESVILTVDSVFSNLEEEKLSSLAKCPIFQKKLINILNNKSRNVICQHIYEIFNIKIIKHNSTIDTVDGWI